jgi:CheY-like chemotaxis protein
MRVLLVDDNALNVELFVDALEADGHTLIVERDGLRGRERALAEKFDVILLDVQLPGMSGDAVCRDLRRAGLTTPIAAITSAAMPEQIARGEAAGFSAYLTKPIAPGELRAAVRGFAAP